MFKLLNCLKYLSLKTATSLLQLLIISIVIGLCSIVLVVNRIMMDALISEFSDKLLFKQNFQQYELQTEMLKYQLNHPMLQRFQMMNRLNILQQDFMPKIQIQSFNQPIECPLYKGQPHESFRTLFSLPEFCISFKNKTKFIENGQIYPFLNFLNQLIIPLTWTPFTTLYMTNTDENYYFASNPPIFEYPFYNPQVRPWYINHIEKSQNQSRQAFASYIYKSYSNEQYSFTITYSLFEQGSQNQYGQGKVQAVIGYDMSFNEYANQLKFQQFIFLITNPLGQIICTNLKYDLKLEEAKSDWFYRNGLVINQILCITLTLCQQLYVIDLTSVQIQLKISRRYHTTCIKSQFRLFFDYVDYIENLFSFQNVTIQKENIEMAEKTKLEVIKAFARNISYLVGASLALLLSSWTGMYLFFRPIKQMRQKMETIIRMKFSSPNWMQKIQNEFDEKNSNYLKDALKNLKSKITNIKRKKCQNCYFIENFKYPKKCLTVEFYEIKNKINEIPNVELKQELIDEKDKNNDGITSSSNCQNPITNLIGYKLYTQTLNSEIDENINLVNSMEMIL